jgi:hypothetical protein
MLILQEPRRKASSIDTKEKTIVLVDTVSQPEQSLLLKQWAALHLTTDVLHQAVRQDLVLVSRSRSHITTDGQSASSSWYPAPFGASDQILHLFE